MPFSYNSTLHGISGNMTVNGKSTCDVAALAGTGLARRRLGAAVHPDINVNTPPYAYMPFPLYLEHECSYSAATGSTTARPICRPTRSQPTRRTMVASSSLTRIIFSARWRSSRRTPRCARCSLANARSSLVARRSPASASTPGTGCARCCAGRMRRGLMRAAARRQLLEVGVHALHDPGCPPVPDVPDPDGRRGHVSRRVRGGATSGSSSGVGVDLTGTRTRSCAIGGCRWPRSRRSSGMFRGGQGWKQAHHERIGRITPREPYRKSRTCGTVWRRRAGSRSHNATFCCRTG
jgi:hypothetical protein